MGSKIAKTIENISMNYRDSSEDLSQNPLIKCENCEKIFKEKRQLNRHVRQVHEKKQANKLIKKSFACEQCGAIYTSLRQVQYCKCKTRKRSRGKDPEKDPYDRCVYQCQVCSRKYGDRRVLRNHIIQLHKTSYQDYLQQFGDPTVECPKWSCLLCKSTMKFFRNSIETHLNQQHTLSLEEFELEHGRPKHPSDPSSIPPSNSVSIQPTGQHPHQDEAPSAEYRSPLPSTSAQSLSLAESYRKLATANSWLPVPQLNHRVSSAITPLRHGHGVISAKRSVPLPCVSGEPPSDKSGGEINTEAVPGRPHSSVSVADEADLLPMDFSDVEETFPSSLEML